MGAGEEQGRGSAVGQDLDWDGEVELVNRKQEYEELNQKWLEKCLEWEETAKIWIH